MADESKIEWLDIHKPRPSILPVARPSCWVRVGQRHASADPVQIGNRPPCKASKRGATGAGHAVYLVVTHQDLAEAEQSTAYFSGQIRVSRRGRLTAACQSP